MNIHYYNTDGHLGSWHSCKLQCYSQIELLMLAICQPIKVVTLSAYHPINQDIINAEFYQKYDPCNTKNNSKKY